MDVLPTSDVLILEECIQVSQYSSKESVNCDHEVDLGENIDVCSSDYGPDSGLWVLNR